MTIQRSKYTSRLSPEEVAAIRAAPLATRHADLARKYGVSASTVARIRKGLTWPEDRPEEVRVRVPAAAVAGLEEAARQAGTTPAGLLADAAVRASEASGSGQDGPAQEEDPGTDAD